MVVSAPPHRGRPPKADSLPELGRYQDTGCRFQPSCLSCPLPTCVLDVSRGGQKMVKGERDAEVRRRRAAGEDPLAIARGLKVSLRTVQRVLQGVGGG